MAHYWIARRALGAFFALVTLLAVMSFGACGTISTLNKTKPARVPTGRQIKFAIYFTIFASMTLSIPLSNRVTKISFLNIEQAINLVLNSPTRHGKNTTQEYRNVVKNYRSFREFRCR